MTQKKLLMFREFYRNSKIKPNYSALAIICDCSRKTVKKYLTLCDEELFSVQKRKRKSKLDPYKEIISDKLDIPGISLVGIYGFLTREVNSEIGTYQNFVAYVHKNLPDFFMYEKKKVVHKESAPGEEIQIDWKKSITLSDRSGQMYKINVFALKFSFSRFSIFLISKEKNTVDLVRCLTKALIRCGGIPQTILLDNDPTILIKKSKRRSLMGILSTYSKDFNFRFKKCGVARPNQKGKVEASNNFLRRLLAYNGAFDSWDDLDKICSDLESEYNMTPNSTTGKLPIVEFSREINYLKELPPKSIVDKYINYTFRAKVHSDSTIIIDSIKYEIPEKYINKYVDYIIDYNIINIYYMDTLVVTHVVKTI